MLINKSHPQPTTKKAPRGGQMIVTRMRITSEALTDMGGVWRVMWSCFNHDVLDFAHWWGCCGSLAGITADV
jgi:hypothetical protein